MNTPFVSLKWRVLSIVSGVVLLISLSQYLLLRAGLQESFKQQRAATAQRLSSVLDSSFVIWVEKIEQMAGIIASMKSLADALESSNETQTRDIITQHADVLHLDLGVETIQVYDRNRRLAMHWGGPAMNLDALVLEVSSTHRPRHAQFCEQRTCYIYTIVPMVQSGPYKHGVVAMSFNLTDMLNAFIKISGAELRLIPASTHSQSTQDVYNIRLEPKSLPLPKGLWLVSRFNATEERALLSRVWQRSLIFSVLGFLVLAVAVLVALWKPLKRLGHTASSFELLAAARFSEFRDAIRKARTKPPFDEVDIVNQNAIKAAVGLEKLELAHVKRKIAEESSLESIRFIESEKKRIARELHDQMGQVLVAVLFDARAIAQTHKPAKIVDIQHRARRIIDSLNGLYDQVNNIIDSLRPELLDTRGLRQAIQALVDHWNKIIPSCQITFKMGFNVHGLSDDVNISIYRITQESLTNVVKHSSATRVSIEIEVHLGSTTNHENVVLHIKDNGNGFDVQSTPEGGGLHSIRHRSEALGGTFLIKSNASKGTHVIVTLPLNINQFEN